MITLNMKSLSSFAFRYGCSYIGARPKSMVLSTIQGELVFLFKSEHFGNTFFLWVRENFDSCHYSEKKMEYHSNTYYALFLQIPQNVTKKFLYPFRQFVGICNHRITF
jgi:hypothetical protein